MLCIYFRLVYIWHMAGAKKPAQNLLLWAVRQKSFQRAARAQGPAPFAAFLGHLDDQGMVLIEQRLAPGQVFHDQALHVVVSGVLRDKTVPAEDALGVRLPRRTVFRGIEQYGIGRLRPDAMDLRSFRRSSAGPSAKSFLRLPSYSRIMNETRCFRRFALTLK